MPQGEKIKLFAKCQESTRKDLEGAFSVIKSQFAIICGSSYDWLINTMENIILTCLILHNMIVEDEWDTYNGNIDVDYDHVDKDISNVQVSFGVPHDFVIYLQIRRYIHIRGIHQ